MSREVQVRFCESREVRSLPATHPIIVTAVLRSVVRRAGLGAVRAHWPGTEDGFAALTRLTGLAPSTNTDEPIQN
jgi:hypothetical protein